MPSPYVRYCLALGVCLLAVSPAPGQGKFGEEAPEFPPGMFTDGSRYQLSDLRGKVVVLFFYESTCPRCKKAIPERNDVVKAFEGEPVKFIAIGASDTWDDVTNYVRETKLAMPVFADSVGIMETRYGQKMSLNNIWQFRVIGPDGKIVGYDMNKETIKKALEKAKWKYDPKDYDVKVRPAVEAFEWAQWDAGMKLLTPLRKSSTKPVAESANKLHDALKKEAEEWKAEAEKLTEDDPLKAYDLYSRISRLFPGEALAKDVADPLRKLGATKMVTAELAARKAYEQISNGISKMTPDQKKALAQQMQGLAKKHSGTATGDRLDALAKELEK